MAKYYTHKDFSYDDFSYDKYKESDTVKQAGDTLNAHIANKPAEYQSQWQTQINNLMGQIMNRDKFSYDLNGDALYQQYKDKYIQQGKLAMADTMGQAAAMTGGYGNSYAQSVGQQAYQAQLDNLNDIAPELYAMALDRYNREGQDLYNQLGMVSDRENLDYGRYRDQVADYLTERDYLTGRYDSERDYDYSKYNNDRNLAYDKYYNDQNMSYQQHRDAIADERWQQQYEDSKASSEGETYTNTLWKATGTTDNNGNPIFINSEGKTQAFGSGVNPYTGTKHSDAKYGTFSNGYQPNNLGKDSNGNVIKLKNSGMSTNITGKNQTIWEANGKYWLWRGDLNKYIEVDVSDLD